MDNKSSRKVRARSKNSISVSFQYNGTRYRETLKGLTPTPANLKYAASLLDTIKFKIAQGTFNFPEYFPNSKHAQALDLHPSRGKTVSWLLDEWAAHRAANSVQRETERDYDEAIAHVWKPAFGKTLLTEFTHKVIAKWVAAQRTRGASRIRNLLVPLRQAMAYGVSEGYLKANPLTGIVVKKVKGVGETKDIDPFTKAEIDAVRPHLEPQVANLMDFCVWTGLRLGELNALRWEDIDEKRGVVSINKSSANGRIKCTKTASSVREVKLLPAALAALSRQKPHTRLLHRQVFLNPGHIARHRLADGTLQLGGYKPSTVNRPWRDEKALRRRWRKACKAAGVRYRFPRQFRHTYASWMLNTGEAPIWVSQQMGHKNLSETLNTYTRFIASMNPDGGMKAAAALRGSDEF